MKKRKLQIMHSRRALLWIALAAVAAGLFLWLAPPRDNPFKPLDLTDRPGLAIRFKLDHLKRQPGACFAALDAAAVLYTRLPEPASKGACMKSDALTLSQSLTPYSATLDMTCTQTAALYTWERFTARPAAIELFGSPLARIETYGSYACRNIAGTDHKSEHAYANAIDISGFRLASGKLIRVKTHWGSDGPEGEFLERVHAEACGIFSVTLGPDYDAAHADHFHFDMGPGLACR